MDSRIAAAETNRVLVVGLAVLLAAMAVFGLIAWQVVLHPSPLTRFDQFLTDSLHAHAHRNPGLTAVFLFITDLGSTWFLTGFCMLVAGVLVWREQFWLAIIWSLVVGGGALLNVGIKHVFLRDRPEFPPELQLVIEKTPSFTSGHSAGSTVCYGMFGYLLMRRLRGRGGRAAAGVFLTLLVLAIGFSRIYLGAHWFSDVIGGFAVGTMWLAVTITVLEIVRRRLEPTMPGSTGPDAPG